MLLKTDFEEHYETLNVHNYMTLLEVKFLLCLISSDPLLRSASNTSVNFIVGGGGTGVPMVRYPQLAFHPCNFFALGSPIAMFLTVRGVDCLGEDFRLPTCPGFFNIFHPVRVNTFQICGIIY